MLNLNNLEKKLDEALALETKESLTNWLKEKRLKKYLSSFGEGELCQIASEQPSEELLKVKLSASFNFEIEVNSFNPTYNPKLAA
jgi:hypothetical protein